MRQLNILVWINCFQRGGICTVLKCLQLKIWAWVTIMWLLAYFGGHTGKLYLSAQDCRINHPALTNVILDPISLITILLGRRRFVLYVHTHTHVHNTLTCMCMYRYYRCCVWYCMCFSDATQYSVGCSMYHISANYWTHITLQLGPCWTCSCWSRHSLWSNVQCT